MLVCDMATLSLFRDQASRWSVAVWCVTLAGAGTILWLQIGGFDPSVESPDSLISSLAVVVSYGVAGAVLIDRRPDLPFGWLLAGTAACQVLAVVASSFALDTWRHGDTGWLVRVGAATTAVMFFPVAVQGLVYVRFPSGRSASRGLELAIVAGSVGGLVGGVLVGIASAGKEPTAPDAGFFDDDPPVTLLGQIGGALNVLVPVVILLGLAAGVGVVLRYRRAVGIERQQLKWLSVGIVLSVLLFPFAVAEATPGWLDAVDPALFVVTLAIPVLRYRLWSIDTIVRRSVVYGLVTAALVAAYVALTALGATLLSERVSASVAAVAVALAFAPLRARVQRSVDRIAYGGQRDPYRTISELDRRLGEIASPGEMLPAITETVADSLNLPYVGIERLDGTPLAAWGSPRDRLERWDLVHEGVGQGFLVASPRRGEDDFDQRDRALLEDVARHAGVAVHAEVLTADLIASRQRLVTAREEERRRLRRDLHDGLGPTLTGIGLNLDAARSQLAADPARAEQLVRDAKAATSAAIADVRRIVYGLRPPALDNLGLVTALRQQLEQLSTNGCRVSFDATALPVVPAAVEVVAYRTVLEAVTNSIRHGRARHCTVRLDAEADPNVLEIEVDDDGTSSKEWVPGVGLLSICEQAAEVGGTVDAGPIDGGGARVSVRIPIVEGSA